jgi:hypothetical protein
MSKPRSATEGRENHATGADVVSILGSLDDAMLTELLALHPTIRDVEQARRHLSGHANDFGHGMPLKGVAGDIVAIITAGEDEENAAPTR